MRKQSPYRINLLIILVILTEIIFWSVALSVWFYLKEHSEAFRIQREEYLFYVLFSPVVSVIYLLLLGWKNKTLRKFSDTSLHNKLFGQFSNLRSYLKYFCIRIAVSFLLIALINPQYGKNKKEAVSSGADLMIALDVSNSMLAEDMSGEMNRLEIAKLAIEKLLLSLHGDRIGLVVFAESAYNQIPITSDYSAAKLFLSSVSPGMLSSQGTSIGKAIDSCVTAFNFEQPSKKAIIVISDGENHEDDALSAAGTAKEKGIVIHTIGLGSPEGSVIPQWENGKKTGVKRDKNGNTVITKLNEKMLRDIARAGDGIYIKASGTDLGLETLMGEINKMEKSKYVAEMYYEYEDQFQFFLFIGFVLLIIDLFLTEKKPRWKEN